MFCIIKDNTAVGTARQIHLVNNINFIYWYSTVLCKYNVLFIIFFGLFYCKDIVYKTYTKYVLTVHAIGEASGQQ